MSYYLSCENRSKYENQFVEKSATNASARMSAVLPVPLRNLTSFSMINPIIHEDMMIQSIF